ncbi:MAG: winged helix-turn-helix domain-containing protein [Lentisphaeria bacterium]|nr:winged helix-turn-helix domain-containing protein [Lentisphaeria bacterium]
MSEFFTGEIANAKVGRNLVEVEILEGGEGFFRVKSVSSGREFNTSRLEKINNNHQMEEAIMPEDNITTNAEAETNAEVDTPNPAPECATAKKEKKVSLLDLAAKILADTGEALNCKELVAKAKETGWVSTGKTPEQTLYSGIFREIKEKGEASRFKKSVTRKGSFEANA